VRGFIRFAEIVIGMGYYVQMKTSSTSSIESVFSQVRAHKCDNPTDFQHKIALINGRKSMLALCNNKMYEAEDENAQNIFSFKWQRSRDREVEMKKWQNELELHISTGSTHFASRQVYEEHKCPNRPNWFVKVICDILDRTLEES
jgi:hypothetical protein